MKNFLAIILVVIMIFSFAGCGNSTAEFEELLISEKRVSIHSGGKMDFKNRKFESASVSSGFEYEILNSKTVIEKVEFFSFSNTIEYKLENEDGIYKLVSENAQFVRESDFEKIRENIEFPKDIPYAIVKDNDGKTKTMPYEELVLINKENEVKFDNLYSGAEITIFGKISKIGGGINMSGHKMKAYVEIGERYVVEISDPSVLNNYEVGDYVKAKGNIFSATLYVEVFINGRNKTTIEHYNG